MSNLLELVDLRKTYRIGPAEVPVLTGTSLTVARGEFVALVGASGSGKSTLLHIAGVLERADSGTVTFDGREVSKLSRGRRHALRNSKFGFVFQLYHLLPELNVLENVLLPAMIQANAWRTLVRAWPRQQKATAILEELGLSNRLRHRPSQLSGGERQRVAIARALVNDPAILLADEPTGNLDPRTGRTILDVFQRLHRYHQQTILMVTHDMQVASLADRVIKLEDGRVQGA